MCLSVVKRTFTSLRDQINDLRETQQSSNLKNEISNDQSENVDVVEATADEKIFISDRLASMTQMTRKFFVECKHFTAVLQKSMFYKVLTRTTQPAHLASMMIVLFISYNIFPDPKSVEVSDGEETLVMRSKSPFTMFLYLASFSIHFGAQIWMTFVSGLALYFSLPRHTFGMCQEVLFPKYFLLNTLLSVMTVITFTKINANFNDLRWLTQLTLLSLCLLIEMLISFYLTPSLLRLMRAKYQYERELGNGQEIGYQKTLPSFNCEEYKKTHKKFRKVHMMCAMGNVVAICCTFAHLYYLASKINIQ